MSHDLYFIPILFEALEQRVDIAASLRRAFRTIIALGQEERYRRGYAQFLAFMNIVLIAHRRDIDEAEMTAIDDTDATEDLLDELAVLPEIAEAWDSVKRDLAWEPATELRIEFLLRRNDEPSQIMRLSKEDRTGFFRGVVPGTYELSTASGRIIWETTLTKQDLLSAYAFAEEPLRLAADTEDAREEPTRRTVLLEGEVVVSVFAGSGSGRIAIEWQSV